MKRKFLYICSLVFFSAGFYILGLYTHRQAVINNNTYNTTSGLPNFATESQPYKVFAYDKCVLADSVPGDVSCFYKLIGTTNAEVGALANKIIDGTPKDKITDYLAAEYFESRNSYIRAIQQNIDTYKENFCGLDSMRIYGGMNMDYAFLEKTACEYYLTNQYLDLLKYLDQSKAQWGG